MGGQAQLLEDSYLERPSFLRSYPMRIRVLRMESAGHDGEWSTRRSLRSSPSNWTDRIPDCSLNSSSIPTRHASQRMPSRWHRNAWVFRAWWMLYAPVMLIRKSSMPIAMRCLCMVSRDLVQTVPSEPVRLWGTAATVRCRITNGTRTRRRMRVRPPGGTARGWRLRHSPRPLLRRSACRLSCDPPRKRTNRWRVEIRPELPRGSRGL